MSESGAIKMLRMEDLAIPHSIFELFIDSRLCLKMRIALFLHGLPPWARIQSLYTVGTSLLQTQHCNHEEGYERGGGSRYCPLLLLLQEQATMEMRGRTVAIHS